MLAISFTASEPTASVYVEHDTSIVQFANGERCALELAWEAEGGSIFCFGGGRGQQHHPAAPFPRTITVGCIIQGVKGSAAWWGFWQCVH